MPTKRDRTNDLVHDVQVVLEDATDPNHVVEVLAYVMISLGCHMNGIQGKLDDYILSHISERYYSPGRANLADAIILQGCQMLGWGSLPNEPNNDKPQRPTGETIEE
jgi:hypothetical protein